MPSAAAQVGGPVSRRGPTGRPGDRCWRRIFPGDSKQVAEVRRWIEDLLPPCPARSDVTEVASELATNAICHTLSGDGGEFDVWIAREHGVAIIAVVDGGGTTGPQLVNDPLAEHGRGLRIVHALAARVTVRGGVNGRIVEASIPWPEEN